MRKSGILQFTVFSIALALVLTGCTWNDASDNGISTKSTTRHDARPFGTNRMGVTPPSLLPSLQPDRSGVLHNNTNLTQSQKTAQKLTKMHEISSATVLLSDTNAYVGVKLNTPQYGGQRMMGTPNRNMNGLDAINTGLRAKIAKKVKQLNPSIQHVYISASPDFLRQFEGYSNQITNGTPAKSFISNFNDTMRNIFPLNR